MDTPRILGVADQPHAGEKDPEDRDTRVRGLRIQLAAARSRKERLEKLGESTDEADRDILNLRRELRAGGQLHEGDALGNGRYTLVRRLGQGGFATVWEAHDKDRDERVAVKVLHPELARDESRLERFFRGARQMAELTHDSVVRVHELRGEDDGWNYFVMEFAAGGDLRRAVLERRLRTSDVFDIIDRVGGALAAAHAKGLVHRDVKPANVLLGNAGVPRLADFDLVGAADTTGGTRTGAMGTFLYAAPELMDRPQEADARADVYGLGMTAIFALNGADLPVRVMLTRPDRILNKLRCPNAAKEALKKAIAWERTARFSSVKSFCNALRRAMSASPPPRIKLQELPIDQPADSASDIQDLYRRLPYAKGIVGQSPAFAKLLQQVALAASSDFPVLLTGPSGSGKTTIALVCHENSKRRKGPFIYVNCATLNDVLFQSTLFGYKKGAFSDAVKDHRGIVSAASGGTLLLDEIGGISLSGQAILLRFLESGRYRPLGADDESQADLRIIAATNIDLQLKIEEDRLRADLYWRLKSHVIEIPSLAERRGDIAPLVHHFCRCSTEALGLTKIIPSEGALRAAEAAEWPGNLHQLRHAVRSAVLIANRKGSSVVESHHLFPDTADEGIVTSVEDPTRPHREMLKAKGIVGHSRALARLLQRVSLVARTDEILLLTGPVGSGKSLFARLCHDSSLRANRPFIAIQCGALSPEEFDRELFGCKKGAFSGARRDSPGLVGAARGGTLFLDGIDATPLSRQGTLLQLLETGEYHPLGGNQLMQADVRLIIATSVDLQGAVDQGHFRADLYWRLSARPIEVPSLDERRDDVAPLIRHFCQRAMIEPSDRTLRMAEAVEWPGNVRQLANAVQCAALTARSESSSTVEPWHLFPNERAADEDRGINEALITEDPTERYRVTLPAEDIVGRSRALVTLLKRVQVAAQTDVPVLITGPAGVGKTRIARLCHDVGPRAAGPFVEVHCATLTEERFRYELFGYNQDEFARKSGFVRAAECGTLFLDEVAEIPKSGQAALVELFDTKKFRQFNSERFQHADIRIIAATSANLVDAVALGKFSEDLYWRLAVIPIVVPSLAERRDDIVALVRYFCGYASRRLGIPTIQPADEALEAAQAAYWPGNVRELANAVQNAVVVAWGERSGLVLRRHLFPDDSTATREAVPPAWKKRGRRKQ